MHRRHFLKTSAVALSAAALSRPAWALGDRAQMPADAPDKKALLLAAVDAARAAGAAFASAEFRNMRMEFWSDFQNTVYPQPTERFVMAVSVRALVNGYWGYAALDAYPTTDDMARLGRDAVKQARTGARGKPRSTELAPAPVVSNGSWTTPIEIDPFTVAPGDKVDFFLGVCDYLYRQGVGLGAGGVMVFVREDRSFASTDGTFTAQTLYTTSAPLGVGAEYHFRSNRNGQRWADFLGPAGAGWEYLLRAPYQERADQLIEEARRMRDPKPVDIGRFDIVFDAYAMAQILDGTVGEASRLDRALGYHANTLGTSFLNDPKAMIGTYQVGAPRVTITADRSMAKGAATVKWDSEGVAPEPVAIVKDGILNDFQTNREGAAWLADVYEKRGHPLRSSGGAGSQSATMPTIVQHANLALAPGAGSDTFDTLVAGTEKGIAVVGGQVSMDHQCLNGAGTAVLMYEIEKGKLKDVVGGAQYLFRAPEFWKNVVALGGANSARQFGFEYYEPYPLGTTVVPETYTVAAVPAKVRELAIIDVMRKGA